MSGQKKSTLDKMEPPFSGHYYMHQDEGIYKCKSCGNKLFSSDAKIFTGSGWPSFDEAMENAIQLKEAKGERGQEVYCSECAQFLGLLIKGESFTEQNMRYDINSKALKFELAS